MKKKVTELKGQIILQWQMEASVPTFSERRKGDGRLNNTTKQLDLHCTFIKSHSFALM